MRLAIHPQSNFKKGPFKRLPACVKPLVTRSFSDNCNDSRISVERENWCDSRLTGYTANIREIFEYMILMLHMTMIEMIITLCDNVC